MAATIPEPLTFNHHREANPMTSKIARDVALADPPSQSDGVIAFIIESIRLTFIIAACAGFTCCAAMISILLGAVR